MEQRSKTYPVEASPPERQTIYEKQNSILQSPDLSIADNRPTQIITGRAGDGQHAPSRSPVAACPQQRHSAARPLALIEQFCAALDEAGMLYCHWKSNAALDRSATGENDLDLLISRRDREQFTSLVAQFGFKEAFHNGEAFLPGVLSYYAYVPDADRIIHLHAHYQLVLGHDRTKNYHIPIEEAYLASRHKEELFYAPSVEFEFLLFTLRMILKFGTWDAVIGGQSRLPKAAKRELSYLLERIDHSKVHQLLQAHLPLISPMLFDQCAEAIQKRITLWTALHVGRPLTKALESYTRHSGAADIGLKGWRRLANSYRRRRHGQTQKAFMSGGGTMIALVGGDGAGKSTAIAGLRGWLAKDFAVRQIHLGKPPRSLSTHFVRLLVRLMRQIDSRRRSKGLVKQHSTDYAQIFLQFCTARDRYWSYVRARRFVNNGGIVIADRFPVPQIQIMEGAKVATLAGEQSANPVLRQLAQKEEAYYSRIEAPELLIVLRLEPTVAVARKPEEPAEEVYQRAAAIWQAEWTGSKAQLIDASEPQAQVLATLKRMVWAHL